MFFWSEKPTHADTGEHKRPTTVNKLPSGWLWQEAGVGNKWTAVSLARQGQTLGSGDLIKASHCLCQEKAVQRAWLMPPGA